MIYKNYLLHPCAPKVREMNAKMSNFIHLRRAMILSVNVYKYTPKQKPISDKERLKS